MSSSPTQSYKGRMKWFHSLTKRMTVDSQSGFILVILTRVYSLPTFGQWANVKALHNLHMIPL